MTWAGVISLLLLMAGFWFTNVMMKGARSERTAERFRAADSALYVKMDSAIHELKQRRKIKHNYEK